MHVLLDDVAWIAIGLLLLAVLFMIGAGFILLDEGLKTGFRYIRKRLEADPTPSAGREHEEGRTVPVILVSESRRILSSILNPRRHSLAAMWHSINPKARIARHGTLLGPHTGRHKP